MIRISSLLARSLTRSSTPRLNTSFTGAHWHHRSFADGTHSGTLSQGHATQKKGVGAKDVQAEQVTKASGARNESEKDAGAMDSASPSSNLNAKETARKEDKGETKGNPEGIGFADQVGGQSASSAILDGLFYPANLF